jgi:hypothetical protein
MVFSLDATTDVGRDTASAVTSDYTRQTSVFNGKINWVQIDLGKDDYDHFITPEERLNLALTRRSECVFLGDLANQILSIANTSSTQERSELKFDAPNLRAR